MAEPEKKTEKNNQLKECRYCFQKIHSSAKVCHCCSRGQGLWLRTFGNIAIIVPAVMVIVAGVQLFLAHEQNVDASKALETAETAAAKATTALTSVEESRSEARTELAKAKHATDFTLLLTKASNDDRASFFELYSIAQTDEDEFHEMAGQAIAQIIADFQIAQFFQHSIDWKKRHNLDPEKASLDDFGKVFSKELSIRKQSVLRTIWQQERFAKAERLQILYKVITTTPSLKVLASACKLMNEEAKLGKNFVAYAQYAKWWEENRENYNNNLGDQPTDSPDKE